MTMMKTYCLIKAQGMIARKARALILKDRETICTPLSQWELQLARKLMVAGSMDQTQKLSRRETYLHSDYMNKRNIMYNWQT